MTTMVERVAVLSDIHGVLPAMEAVLAESDVAAADRIVLTGDICAGPQPAEVLDLLAELGDRAVWVRGNTDRAVAEHHKRPAEEPGDPLVAWCAAQLAEEHLDLLAALPPTATLKVAGLDTVLFCHATPRDDTEIVLVDSALDRWAEVMDAVDPDVEVVVCGHSHMPYVRLVHGRLVVNPGSVGMPVGRCGAHWALLGPGVELRRTVLDPAALVAEVAEGSAYPQAEEWARRYATGQVSDVETLARLAPRDGRAAPD